MKQLTCEMCGSTNLLKQDGVFVCQSCGTKYSVEEAKKMIAEESEDVFGDDVAKKANVMSKLSKKKVLTIVCAVLVLIVAICLIATIKKLPKSKESLLKSAESIDTKQLMMDLYENPTRAKLTYGGKVVKLTGYVQNIFSSYSSYVSVGFCDNNHIYTSYFPDNYSESDMFSVGNGSIDVFFVNESDAARFDEGDYITVVGILSEDAWDMVNAYLIE